MDDFSPAALTPDNRKELYQVLRKVWSWGANIAIGWQAQPSGIRLV